MFHLTSLSPARLFMAALLMLILPSACQNEEAGTASGATTEEEAPRTRDRKYPIIPFEVHDQSGEPIKTYTVFESFEDGASGTVFQFQHGHASVPFEPGARYRVQAQGFHTLDFEFADITGVKRLIFYMNHTGNTSDTPIVRGACHNLAWRPFASASVVTAGDLSGQTDDQGMYAIPGATLTGTEPTPLRISWKDQEGVDGTLDLRFRELTNDTLRVDVWVDVEDQAG
ncbi:MAG: hypothetical protein J5I41_05140 [Saprospiraceae bacterium]|nr:hypothetical protein [Saprospiraceae bacterium]